MRITTTARRFEDLTEWHDVSYDGVVAFREKFAPEALVGLCMDRSLAMVIALLGILKSGAAYLPIDPRLPADQ